MIFCFQCFEAKVRGYVLINMLDCLITMSSVEKELVNGLVAIIVTFSVAYRVSTADDFFSNIDRAVKWYLTNSVLRKLITSLWSR